MATIEQVREARVATEAEILLAVRAAVDKFHTATGLWPSDVSLYFSNMITGERSKEALARKV